MKKPRGNKGMDVNNTAGDIDNLARLERERGGGDAAVDPVVAQEALMRALLNAITEFAMLFDATGRLLAVNTACERWFGRSERELAGKHMSDLLPAELLASRGGRFHEVIRTGVPVRFEDSNRGRFFDNTIEPVFDARNVPVGAAVFAKDITDRKFAEEALGESEERFRLLFETSIDAILLTAPDGSIEAANPAACAMLGYTEEEIRQLGREGVVDTADPRLTPALKERARTGTFSGELTMIRKGGARFPVEITTALFNDREGRLKTSMVIRDISGRKRAEEAIHESERRLKLAEEAAHIGHYEIDLKTGNASWSDETFRIFGMDPQKDTEPTVEEYAEYIHPEDRRSLFELFAQSAGEGTPFDMVYRIIRKDAVERYIHSIGNVERDELGGPAVMFGTFQDITDRRRAEEALKESEEKYRGLFEGMISGFAFHEIILDEDGKPVDYVTVNVNSSFEKMLGVSREDVLGKKAYEAVPGLDKEWLDVFSLVSLTGKPHHYEQYASNLDKWFYGSAFSTKKGTFAVTFMDITERKKAEEALRENEERFRCIFEQSPVAIEIYDEKGMLVDANPACLETFGVTEFRHVLGFDLFSDPNIPADARKRLAIGESVAFESVFDFDLVREKNLYPSTRSGVRNIDCAIRPLRDAERRTTGYLVHVSDITDRKRAEEALRESEESFRLAFEEARDAIFWADTETGILLNCNRAAENLMEATRGEFIGRHQTELHPPEMADRFAESFRREVERRGSAEEEVIMRSKTGRIFPARVNTSVTRIGGRTIIQGIFRDITERKRAEEALRESIDKFRLLAEYTPDWEYWHDMEGRFIYVSPSVGRITGYRPEEFYEDSKLIDRITFQDDLALVRERIDKALAEDAPLEMEFRIHRKDGGIAWIGHRCVVVWGTDGSKLGRRATNRDISEQKRIEEERRELERQFLQAQKMEMVGRLAGGVAHDFNNLLTTIMGNAELALMVLSPDTPVGDTINEIRKAAERAAGLTRQLLAFSRKEFAEPRVLDLNTVIGEMGKLLRRLIGEHIDLVCEPAPDLGTVCIDPSQIEQVITNLTVNSRDAMPDGGQITISTSNETVDDENPRMRPQLSPGNYVVVTVSDTGTGMSGDVMEHIFEPFFTTKEVGKGTGLGLSTCYGILKQNGGTIEAESEQGKGATLRVYLPKVGKEEIKAGSRVDAQPRRGSETLLVTEDEDSVRKMVVDILRGNGYIVIEAADGENALEKAAAHAGLIDGLVTDMVMPRMGGRELAKRMRVIRPGIRILFMSGYTDDMAHMESALEEGTAFIRKPFSPAGLLGKIGELFGGG